MSEEHPRSAREYLGFDRIAVRTARRLSKQEMADLRMNSFFAGYRSGHPIRGCDKFILLIVVAPNRLALSLLAECPGLLVNNLEVSRDSIYVDEEDVWALRDWYDRHFVQPRHTRRLTILHDNGSYTGPKRPGHSFVWYCDRPYKPTGERYCFHLEGRHHGSVAVRRAGIHSPRDLISFDHGAYWRRHLTLYEIDFARLGRWYLNKMSGQRRRRPRVGRFGAINYDPDKRTGHMLFRIFGQHPMLDFRSVQLFVDRFGRGPFLRRVVGSSSIVI